MEALQAAFDLAALDAGVERAEVLLRVLTDVATVNGNQAVSWPSDLIIDDDDDLRDLGEHAIELNGPGRNRHRIVLCADVDLVVNAALIRHELEHVAQFKADRRIYRQHGFAVDRLVKTFGPTGSRYYNMIPIEFEANLAASRFVRAQYGDLRVGELYESRPDLRRLLKEYPHPSVVRMQQFLAVFDAIERSQKLN